MFRHDLLKGGLIRSYPYILYINGLKVMQDGYPSDKKEESLPVYKVSTGQYKKGNTELEVILHISNYRNLSSAALTEIMVGQRDKIINIRSDNLFWILLMSGALLIMSIYHFGLFALRPKDKNTLIFAIICFFVTIRNLIMGERLLGFFFPETVFAWHLAMAIEFLSAHMLLPLFFSFFKQLFPKEINKIPYRIVIGGSLLWTFICIFLPSFVMSKGLKYFEYLVLFGVIFCLLTLVKAVIRKREGALIILSGFFVLVLASFHDILLSNEIISSIYLIPFSFFFVLLSQSFLLSIKFTNSFKKVESLSIDLKKTFVTLEDKNREQIILTETLKQQKQQIEEMNRGLEEKIQERTHELEERNKNILDSIRYAKIIQSSILPKPEILSSYLKEHFEIWKPRDIVGGDFYWFEPLEDGFLLAVIDCTGHGVPGALMTMSVTTVLRQVVSYVNKDDPSLILAESNKILRKLLNQQSRDSNSNDGFDIGLCLYKASEKTLFYAGAHIPLIILSNGMCHRIKGNRQGIGYPRSKEDYEYVNHSISLNSGDTFYLTSDGIVDQFGGEHGYSLGWKRFHIILEKMEGIPLDGQKEYILQELKNYQNEYPQIDDITLLGFKI